MIQCRLCETLRINNPTGGLCVGALCGDMSPEEHNEQKLCGACVDWIVEWAAKRTRHAADGSSSSDDVHGGGSVSASGDTDTED